MNDAAAHLVDRVLPLNAIRQWVCTMPFSLRYLMGYDKKLCADILSGYAAQLMRWYKQRGKQLLGLKSINEAHTGAVTIVQRFDSALRLNVHAHTLCVDGVYTRDESSGQLVFHQLPEPTHQQVEQLASRIAESSEKVMRKHGLWIDDDSEQIEAEQLSLEHPALSQCYSAAVRGVEMLSERAGRPCMRLLSTPRMDNTFEDPGAVAVVRGFNLHGKTRVDGQDREQLEKLCRYIARPPIAQQRLNILEDGRVRYDMKRIWKDGTKAIVLSPFSFIARLCALVPPPYFHLTRFHGLLAPNSKYRAEVVPQPEQMPGSAQQLQLFDANESGTQDKPATAGRFPWAWLLKRVFRVDITVCPRCQGSLKVTELVIKRDEILKRLAQQGLGPMPPPKPLPKVDAQLALRFDDFE
jgi:hypothetical protein